MKNLLLFFSLSCVLAFSGCSNTQNSNVAVQDTVAEIKSQNPLIQMYKAIKDGTLYEIDGSMPGTKLQVDPNTLSQEAKFDADGNLWVLQDNSALHGRDVIIYYNDGRRDSYGSMWFDSDGYMEYYVEVNGQTVLKDSNTMEKEHNDMVNKFNTMTDCYNKEE